MLPDKDLHAIKAFYISQAPKGWTSLRALAEVRADQTDNPFNYFHKEIWIGTHVAAQQKTRWRGLHRSIDLAYHYGFVFEAAADYVSAVASHAGLGLHILYFALPKLQELGERLDKITSPEQAFNRPVPSALAVLDTLVTPIFCETLLSDYHENLESLGFVPTPPKYLRQVLFSKPQV